MSHYSDIREIGGAGISFIFFIIPILSILLIRPRPCPQSYTRICLPRSFFFFVFERRILRVLPRLFCHPFSVAIFIHTEMPITPFPAQRDPGTILSLEPLHASGLVQFFTLNSPVPWTVKPEWFLPSERNGFLLFYFTFPSSPQNPRKDLFPSHHLLAPKRWIRRMTVKARCLSDSLKFRDPGRRPPCGALCRNRCPSALVPLGREKMGDLPAAAVTGVSDHEE